MIGLWMPEEPQVESSEHQHQADIHDQPFPESVSEEREVDSDYDGCHRQYIKYDHDPTAHDVHFVLASATIAALTASRGPVIPPICSTTKNRRSPPSSAKLR